MSDTQVDLADVRRLGELEKGARAFLEALAASEPAMERLEAAGYPGATYASDPWGTVVESVQHLAEGLEDLRLADGDWAAADYRLLVVRMGLGLDKAAIELIGWDKLPRVEPLRRYAESVA